MTIRVVLVDDQKDIRESVAAMLSVAPDIEVVGQARDGKSGIDLVDRLRPDVVLMDIEMPGMTGIEATRVIHAEHDAVKVVGLSTHTDRVLARHMLEAGASGYVDKVSAHAELVRAVRRANAGETYLSGDIAAAVFDP